MLISVHSRKFRLYFYNGFTSRTHQWRKTHERKTEINWQLETMIHSVLSKKKITFSQHRALWIPVFFCGCFKSLLGFSPAPLMSPFFRLRLQEFFKIPSKLYTLVKRPVTCEEMREMRAKWKICNTYDGTFKYVHHRKWRRRRKN